METYTCSGERWPIVAVEGWTMEMQWDATLEPDADTEWDVDLSPDARGAYGDVLADSTMAEYLEWLAMPQEGNAAWNPETEAKR